jgi:hypothetical protein
MLGWGVPSSAQRRARRSVVHPGDWPCHQGVGHKRSTAAWPRALDGVWFRGHGVWGWRRQDLEALVSVLVVGRAGPAP